MKKENQCRTQWRRLVFRFAIESINLFKGERVDMRVDGESETKNWHGASENVELSDLSSTFKLLYLSLQSMVVSSHTTRLLV